MWNSKCTFYHKNLICANLSFVEVTRQKMFEKRSTTEWMLHVKPRMGREKEIWSWFPSITKHFSWFTVTMNFKRYTNYAHKYCSLCHTYTLLNMEVMFLVGFLKANIAQCSRLIVTWYILCLVIWSFGCLSMHNTLCSVRSGDCMKLLNG